MMNLKRTSRFAIPRPAAALSYILLVISSLVALQPLFRGLLPWSADGLLHFHRLAQLDRALGNGKLFPRWMPDMGFGFGFPLFNYYAPLSYYLIEPLHLLGGSISVALLAGLGLAILVAGAGSYLWVRGFFGVTAGLIAAIAYVYAPYTLYNVFHRGALAEAWGLALLPWILWALRRLALRGRAFDFVLAALSYCALILTHNILAMVCSPILAGYALFLWLLCRDGASGLSNHVSPNLRRERWRRAVLLSGVFLLGLGLSAFFWVPAFFEKEYVQIHQLYAPGVLNYRNNFAGLSDLLAAPFPVDPALINPPTPRSFGWPQLVLTGIGLLTLPRWRRREARAHIIVLALTILGLTALMLPLSTPLWDRLPLLRFVQFPWRFLGPAGLALSALAGAGVAQMPNISLRRRPASEDVGEPVQKGGGHLAWLWPTIAFLAIVLFGLTWLFPARYPSQRDPTPIDLIRFEEQTGALGTTSAGDYLPVWVNTLPSPDTLLPTYEAAAPDFVIPRFDETSLPSGATVVQADYAANLTGADITFDTPAGSAVDEAGWTARFNWYFFPGWQAELDREPHILRPDGPHGLIATHIPPGRHRLTISLGDTALRRQAWWMSLFSLIALIGLTLLLPASRRGRQTQQPAAAQPALLTVPFTLVASIVLVAVSAFVLKTGYLDSHETLFRRSRFDGKTVSGVHVPLNINFGDEMVLMGYDLDAARVRADGVVELVLYWRAQPPLDLDYSIAVHLVDDQGRRFGQQDNQHPAGYPTSRWVSDEYARDVHRLAVWPATPPGEYMLLVSVYDVRTGHRLDLIDPNNVPIGTTYPVTQVQVSRPARPPRLDDISMERVLQAGLGGGLTLLGLDQPPGQVTAGDRLPVTLYLRARSAPDADYYARLRLVATDGTVASEEHGVPGRADHPTSVWREGDVLRHQHSLLVPATTPNGAYDLRVDLLDANRQPIGPALDLATVAVNTPERSFELPRPQHTLDHDRANLGDLATLLGYDLSVVEPTLTPGQIFHVTLFWQARTTADVGYTAFVHLLDASEQIYAQRDQVPAGGTRPTTGWVTGEFIGDTYELTLATDAHPGAYRLEVGLYDPASGDRLNLLDAAGNAIDTRILLPTQMSVEE